jgi:3-isopropylmalate/(R)-2-methylmalate dehydratase small subunit
MEQFVTLQAVAAPLIEPNINTDDILPSVWVLNANTNLGEKLFANRRYEADGRETQNFVLNQEPFRRAQILLSGPNFGCGSSREAAVWALRQFGIRCIVAPSFGDIFYENCFQNGVLPILLPAELIGEIVGSLSQSQDKTLRVDLQTCRLGADDLGEIQFEVTPQRRSALLLGQDSMSQLLSWTSEVEAYEKDDRAARPWIYLGPRNQGG